MPSLHIVKLKTNKKVRAQSNALNPAGCLVTVTLLSMNQYLANKLHYFRLHHFNLEYQFCSVFFYRKRLHTMRLWVCLPSHCCGACVWLHNHCDKDFSHFSLDSFFSLLSQFELWISVHKGDRAEICCATFDMECWMLVATFHSNQCHSVLAIKST